MRISDFIETTNNQSSPETIFSTFTQSVEEFGFDRVALVAVTASARATLAARGREQMAAVSGANDWLRHYVDSSYADIDPVMLTAPQRRQPFLWQDLLDQGDFTQRQRNILLESEDAGLRSGLSVPVHGPNGETYVVSLASETLLDSASLPLGTLHVLSLQFQLAYLAATEVRVDPLPTTRLTARERECLTWTARGKSAWAISRILGVSEHTATFHLKSAMKKLETNSRVQAAVIAIRMGLIQP